MNWTEICIHTTQAATEIISNVLIEAGSSGVVIEDPYDLVQARSTSLGEVHDLNPNSYPRTGVYVKGYLADDEHLDKKLTEIRHIIEQLHDPEIDFGEKTIHIAVVYEEDWANAWKQYYKPVTISNNITITPSWEHYERAHSNEKVITLDPGMAFGTGTHQTTALCIKAIEKYMQREDHVIDVGTGTGILSIVAALLGAKEVRAFDLDPVAVKSAKENIVLNGVDKKVSIQQNNLLNDITGQADLIVANLLADIIMDLAKDLPRVLKEDGYVIVSGIIERQRPKVESHLLTYGLIIEERFVQDDWLALVAKRKEGS